MPHYDVFLSHASADKPAVEHLARKLREEGLEPFLDKWHLIPGDPWQEGMEEALRESRTCAVFLGKALGPWQNEEMRTALARRVKNRSYRVIPVLLPGGADAGLDQLSDFLGRLTWVDFRAGLADEDAFRHLLAGIRGEAPGLSGGGEPHSLLDRYRCMAPAREPFVQRSEYAKVRDALLADGAGRATTVGITTALHGAGGFGKTALALELCCDEQVRRQYPDGILWTTMGEEIDDAGRLARVRDLIRWWTEKDPPAFETVSAASAHLRQELNGKRMLLVVDDVWHPEDVTSFQGLEPGAALLVTTRDSRTLPAGSMQVHVDAMEVPEAVRLLGAGLPDRTGVDLRDLATRLGEWPLLLKIVNRQLRELIQQYGLSLELALKEVNEALDAEGLTAFDREDFESRNQAVTRTVGASFRRLSGDEVGRFEQLAIFPEDKDISVRILEKLWGLSSYATKKLCGRLHDLSLLLRFDRPAGTIRLHDVIRAYLVKNGEGHLAEWHQCLLDAIRPANGRWPDLPQDENYLWYQLFHHLTGAGQSDVCWSLLLDFHYLNAKLRATDINAVLADYSSFVEQDPELRLVRDALRLSAHVLARNSAELPGQLLGRLLDRQETGIRGLTQASEGFGAPWLRPRKARLIRPGSPLIRTIDHPGVPHALAVFPGGRVISGSGEGTLCLWDIESGQVIQIFEGHCGSVNAVARLGSRRMVSGSDDGTLRVWDVESGRALKVLEGHSDWVFAVGVLDNHRVVSGSDDRTLRVWDVESGRALAILRGHSDGVSSLAVLDCRRVISGSFDETLRVWDVERGRNLAVLEGHPACIASVAVLDSQRVVSGCWGGKICLWDIERGKAISILKSDCGISSVGVLGRRQVISGHFDATLRVWDVESGRALAVLKGHLLDVNAIAVLDGRRVVSGSDDRTLRVWSFDSGQTTANLEKHPNLIRTVTAVDSRRFVTSSDDAILRVWDVNSGEVLVALEGHSERVNAVAVLGGRVISGSYDVTLRMWDVDSGETLTVFEGPYGEVRAVAFLDSRRLVSGSDDGVIRIWSSEGQELEGDEVNSTWFSAMAVLDGHRVILGSASGVLRLWDITLRRVLAVFKGHSASIKAVSVLDEERLVSASEDGTLRVWKVGNREAIQVLKGHSSGIYALAVLDSHRVISASDDQTLRVWNVENGVAECLFTLEAPVYAVAVLPGSRIIVAGDGSGRIHLFDFVES